MGLIGLPWLPLPWLQWLTGSRRPQKWTQIYYDPCYKDFHNGARNSRKQPGKRLGKDQHHIEVHLRCIYHDAVLR